MGFRWQRNSSQTRIDRIRPVDPVAPNLAPLTEDKVKELATQELPPIVLDGADASIGSYVPHVDQSGWTSARVEEFADSQTSYPDDDVIVDGGNA